MKGSTQKKTRKKGTVYQAVIDLPTDDGSRKQKKKSFQSWNYDDPQQQARAWLAKINLKINNGEIVGNDDISFNALAREWHNDDRDRVASNTVTKREQALDNHILPYFEGVELSDMTSYKIQGFYDEKVRDLAPSTVHVFHNIIKPVLDDAVRLGRLDSNPAEATSPPEIRQQDMTVWNRRQIQKFVSALNVYEHEYRHSIPYSHYPLFFTAINTGLRIGELLGLRMCDIDLDEGYIEVRRSLKKNDGLYLGDPKNRSSIRCVKLIKENVFVLRKQLQARREMKQECRDWGGKKTVFVTNQGNYIWPSTVRRKLNNVLDRTDLPRVTPHEFRHTHATLLLQSGVPIYNVSRRLGHSSVETTEKTYIQYVPSMQQETVDKYQQEMNF